ncbi:MAG: acyl-CoA/acyl-ACP dehydrogenase [Nitrospirae bacterium]|nr:acyl-CoA/acyl-ACP dehydrogenase [Nitrospirota bacterium]
MIDFTLTEEEEMIRESARSFASDKLRPAGEKHEDSGRVQSDIAEEYKKLGFGLLELPTDLGGAGLTPFAKSLVMEELGWGDAGAALAIEGCWPAYYAITEGAPKDLQKSLLGKLSGSGEAPKGVLVVDTDARLQVNGSVEGTASFVTGSGADVAVVLKDKQALIIEGQGLKFKPLVGCALQASGPSEVQFSKAKVLHAVKDAAAYEKIVARIRIYTASLLVGVARASFEYAMKYAQERSAFGKPIAHHQAIAFYIAEMAMAVDAARLAVWRAIHQLNLGSQVGWHAAAAYQEAAQQSRFVTDWGLQILGGHGYIKDHPVEKWMREAQVLTTIWGGVDQADLDACELVLAE